MCLFTHFSGTYYGLKGVQEFRSPRMTNPNNSLKYPSLPLHILVIEVIDSSHMIVRRRAELGWQADVPRHPTNVEATLNWTNLQNQLEYLNHEAGQIKYHFASVGRHCMFQKRCYIISTNSSKRVWQRCCLKFLQNFASRSVWFSRGLNLL
jgi:hypothetical protein